MRWLYDSDASGETSRTQSVAVSRTAEEHAGKSPGALLTTFVPGDVVAERFEILRFLGQGGMGQVFEAWDLELGVSVALKVVRPDLANRADVVRRFKSEVLLARRVTHPHVCRIYDLVYHRGTALPSWGGRGRILLIVTMEMLRGETLGQRLKRSGAFTPAEALPLISQMAAALDAAHKVGIVHRDFKSANVMLVDSEEGDGRGAVVTDFSLAVPHRVARRDRRAVRPPLAVNGPSPVTGTPAYIAPELVAGHEAGAAADVYSFGVVLYEMMTGLLPFRAKTPEKTARLHLEADPTPPSRHRPELSPAWDGAILRCLSRDPERRFASAGEVVEALGGDVSRPRNRRTGPALAAVLVAVLLTSMLASGDRQQPPPGRTSAAAASAVEPPAPESPRRGRAGRRRASPRGGSRAGRGGPGLRPRRPRARGPSRAGRDRARLRRRRRRTGRARRLRPPRPRARPLGDRRAGGAGEQSSLSSDAGCAPRAVWRAALASDSAAARREASPDRVGTPGGPLR